MHVSNAEKAVSVTARRKPPYYGLCDNNLAYKLIKYESEFVIVFVCNITEFWWEFKKHNILYLRNHNKIKAFTEINVLQNLKHHIFAIIIQKKHN